MNSARAIQFQPGEISAAATVRDFRTVQPEGGEQNEMATIRNSRLVQTEGSRVEEHLKKMGAVWK